MDWLEDRQDDIEAGLPRRHLGPEPNPARMALFDLSSLWLEGRRCPLAARGYCRDGRKGRLQIDYGLLTGPHGRPVAVRVSPGNAGDPGRVHRHRAGAAGHVRAGQHGHGRGPRHDHQRPDRGADQHEDGTPRPDAYGWITALRAPAIKKLMAEDGPLQLSLLD